MLSTSAGSENYFLNILLSKKHEIITLIFLLNLNTFFSFLSEKPFVFNCTYNTSHLKVQLK